MNEQNNNLNPGVGQPTQPSLQPQVPTGEAIAPVQEVVQPTPEAVQVQDVQQPIQEMAPIEDVAPMQEVIQPVVLEAAPDVVPVQDVQPIQEMAPVQEVVQTVVEAAPMQADVMQTTTLEATPVVQEPVMQPIQTDVQPQQVAPIENVSQNVSMDVNQTVQGATIAPSVDIVQQEPINPVGTEFAQDSFGNPISTPVQPMNTVNPMMPTGGAMDATGVGFVDGGEPMKKKSKLPIIIAIGAVILIGAGIGAFFYFKSLASNPMNIYENTIRTLFKSVNTTVDDYVRNKGIVDLKFSYDTNIEELKSFAGYTYGINAGIDPVNKTIQAGLSIKNASDVGYSYDRYLKDNKEYVRYSTFKDLMYIGEMADSDVNELLTSFEDIFATAENVNNDEINYLVDKLADLVVGSIQEDKLTKEDASININGENIKVTNNKYAINEETAKAMVKHIVDGLKNDEKTIEIIAKLTETEKDQIKEMLTYEESEEEEPTDTENDNKDLVIYTNIYTLGMKAEIVGFALTTSEDDFDVHYYKKGDYFEVVMNTKSEDIETGKEEEHNLSIIGSKKDDITNVTVTIDEKELVTLKVKSWTESLKEFDYIVEAEEMKITGTIKLSIDKNDKRNKINLNASAKMGDQTISGTLEFTEDWTAEVANINTTSAVTVDDAELALKTQEFMNALKNTPVGALLETVSGSTSPNIDDYYNMTDPQVDVNGDVVDPSLQPEEIIPAA